MAMVAIVDDNKIILDTIYELVRELFNKETIIKIYDKSTSFFNDADKFDFDLVMLDIDMPDINGFEIAKNLKEIKPSIVIIFVSNVEHLVFDSLKFNPFRFVRKSNLNNDLQEAISNYKIKIKEDDRTYFLKTNKFEKNIQLLDIIYFESKGHEIYIHTLDKKYKLKRGKNGKISLKYIEEELGESGFIRIHQSFLVNYKYIFKFRRNQIQLQDNTIININPHKTAEIKTLYSKYLILWG